MMSVSEAANGQTVDLAVGETLDVHLSENRGTGYRWHIVSSGEPVVDVARDSYEAAAGPPGRPGTHTWQLRAVRLGEGRFDLAYRRPWEGEQPSARSFSLVLRVVGEPSAAT
jgi:predicted secreted protein